MMTVLTDIIMNHCLQRIHVHQQAMYTNHLNPSCVAYVHVQLISLNRNPINQNGLAVKPNPYKSGFRTFSTIHLYTFQCPV